MVSLNRTVPLSQVDGISKLIRQDLKFDMPRMLHIMLQIHGPVPECHLRFFLSRFKAGFKFFRGFRHTHSFAAASKGRLHDHRISDLPGKLCPGFRVHKRLCTARHHRYASGDHRISGLLFISQFTDDLRFRADKCNITLFAQLSKPAVFRKESKARMDRVRSGNNGCADDLLHAQITPG